MPVPPNDSTVPPPVTPEHDGYEGYWLLQTPNWNHCANFRPVDVGVKRMVTEHPEVVVTNTPGTQVERDISTANDPSSFE
jgi:hypothetical protein